MEANVSSVLQALAKTGIPPTVLRGVVRGEIPKELFASLDSLVKTLLKTDKIRVVLVSGPDCPEKDQFIGEVLRWYMQFYWKKGKWLVPSAIPKESYDETPEGTGVTAILGIDLLTPTQCRVVATMLREHTPRDRNFILSSDSLVALELKLGKEIVDYVASMMIQVTPPIKRPAIVGI